MNKGNLKHGYCGTRIYEVWKTMKQRCSNPNSTKYHRYGARGITVCDEWVDNAKAFIDWAMANGYKDGLTIDRIDNDKGYSPDNCRWVNNNVQALNRTQHKSNTGHLGISKRVESGKRGERIRFVARVKRFKKMYNVGSFKTLEEAIKARDSFIKNNFPETEVG